MLAGATLAPGEVSADFVYNVVNYPALQNGYTVSGTITTLVDQGTSLPPSDITAWNITITGPSFTSTFTPTNSSKPNGLFDATPTSLMVGLNGGVISFSGTTTGEIEWIGPSFDEYTYSTANGTSLWDASLDMSTNPVAVIQNTVPEPSSVGLAVFGAVTGFAYGWVRKRRSQLRHDEGGQPQPTE